MTGTKPRLLVLASTYPRWSNDHEPGFVHELSKRLARTFEVHVICPHAPGASSREEMDSVHIHRFRYAPATLETLVQGGGIINNLRHQSWKWLLVPFFFLGLAGCTARLILRLRPACLHVHWILPQGLALLFSGLFIRRLPPFLLTSHGGDLYGLRGALPKRLKRWVIDRADAMSVVNRPMSAMALELGANPGRLSIIPMGVDFSERFKPGLCAARSPAEILFVGRLVEKKGLRYLVDAMPAILRRFPDARLVIAGYGPEESALRTQSNQLDVDGSVEFRGAMPQSALPDLYCGASVFVSPFIRASSGDQDGLPVALMEAIACGCPIVVGDLPALDDLFEADEADMRVDPKDVHALASRIIATLENPDVARQRAAQLRTRLKKQMDWEVISERYLVLLKSILPVESQ